MTRSSMTFHIQSNLTTIRRAIYYSTHLFFTSAQSWLNFDPENTLCTSPVILSSPDMLECSLRCSEYGMAVGDWNVACLFVYRYSIYCWNDLS